MYQSLYTLISELVFNGTLTPFQDELIQVLATVGSLFVVALPVIILVQILKSVTSLWR